MTKRVAFYVRVSTDQQSVDMQRVELTAVAERAGWQLVEVYEDAGISGAKGRDKRPAFGRMLRDATRRKFDVLAVWAADRLGRSLQDLVATLSELRAAGVDLYLNKQAVDTTTPSGKALFGMLGVFAEFERDMIVERVRAGLARAKTNGTKSGKAIGRPRQDSTAIGELLASGASLRQTAQRIGISLSNVKRGRRRGRSPSPISRGQAIQSRAPG
jgi:DNA invertase Pin-like site-specific DNA recombinase